MTHDDLAQLLAQLPGAAPGIDDPDLVPTLEAWADQDPGDPLVREALLAAHLRATAEAGLRPHTAGVSRGALVRWDAHATTWIGTETQTGRPAMVRVLRPHAARDPVLRRQLAREGRALRPVLPALRHVDDVLPALVVELPGPPCLPSRGGTAGEHALARLLAGSLHHLLAWERFGPGLPEPAPAEVRDAGDHVAVVSLTPPSGSDAGPVLRRLADVLLAWWQEANDSPVAELLGGLQAAPPRRVADVEGPALAALAELLAAERHRLVHRRASAGRADRTERLARIVARLDAAVPPPAGRAALGVDLEGQTLVVESDGDVVLWGAEGEEPGVVFDLEEGFDVPAARRLVRARGEAPISARLNAEVGGDPAFAERIARWVAAALDLRTTRMLLEAVDG